MFEQNSLKDLETKFIVNNYHSFATVDQEELKALFQFGIELGAKYGNIDCNEFWFGRKSITNNLGKLKIKYESLLMEKINEAKNISAIAISSDI